MENKAGSKKRFGGHEMKLEAVTLFEERIKRLATGKLAPDEYVGEAVIRTSLSIPLEEWNKWKKNDVEFKKSIENCYREYCAILEDIAMTKGAMSGNPKDVLNVSERIGDKLKPVPRSGSKGSLIPTEYGENFHATLRLVTQEAKKLECNVVEAEIESEPKK